MCARPLGHELVLVVEEFNLPAYVNAEVLAGHFRHEASDVVQDVVIGQHAAYPSQLFAKETPLLRVELLHDDGPVGQLLVVALQYAELESA